MFFDTEERRQAIQEMIVADTVEARKAALAKLLPFQRDDFYGIFKAMDGRPVTIRLVDPPLHEFVPHDEPHQKALAEKIGIPSTRSATASSSSTSRTRCSARGCRLCITYRRSWRCRSGPSPRRR